LTVKTFSGFEHQCLGGLDDGRALVADVAGEGVLEGRLLHGLRAEDFAQAIEADFFADVELDEDED
jgi:hypothetical protein